MPGLPFWSGRAQVPVPRIIEGASVPLFDRLVDLTPEEKREATSWRRLSREEAKESVARELARLFDARRAEPLEIAAERTDLTVLDYGIPDYGNRSPADSTGRRLFERAIQRAIAAFEPRLIGPEVELETFPGRPSMLLARITGVLATGDIVEPVSFEIDLGVRRAAEVEIGG
jgi:type VI secretion system protein ImpF